MNKEIGFNKDIDIKKTHETVLAICNKSQYEIMRCIKCPILLECKYPKKKLDSLRTEATTIAEEIYKEEIELDNSAENVLRAQNKRDYTYSSYLQDNAHKVLKNNRCIYERKEILDSLSKFVDAGYDINDPRVFTIVNELVGNILNSGRANKAFTNLGVILKKDTPAGPIYYQNPLLKIKIEFSKIIIEATETLDRILKSDESQSKDKNFTAHLMRELKIREKQKSKLLDELSSPDDKLDEYNETEVKK